MDPGVHGRRADSRGSCGPESQQVQALLACVPDQGCREPCSAGPGAGALGPLEVHGHREAPGPSSWMPPLSGLSSYHRQERCPVLPCPALPCPALGGLLFFSLCARLTQSFLKCREGGRQAFGLSGLYSSPSRLFSTTVQQKTQFCASGVEGLTSHWKIRTVGWRELVYNIEEGEGGLDPEYMKNP